MPAFIPLIGALVGAGASMYSSNKQKKAGEKGAAGLEGIAAQQAAAAQAEKNRFYFPLTSTMQGFNTTPIPQNLTDREFNFFSKNVDKDAAFARTLQTQGFDRRGLRDSGIAAKGRADLESGLADVKTARGMALQRDAALTNNAANMQLAQLLMQGYTGGQSQMLQSNQIGAGLQSDALGARLAGTNNYYGTLASGLGGLVGAAGQSYDAWKQNTASTAPTAFQPGNLYPATVPYPWAGDYTTKLG